MARPASTVQAQFLGGPLKGSNAIPQAFGFYRPASRKRWSTVVDTLTLLAKSKCLKTNPYVANSIHSTVILYPNHPTNTISHLRLSRRRAAGGHCLLDGQVCDCSGKYTRLIPVQKYSMYDTTPRDSKLPKDCQNLFLFSDY